MGNIVVVDLIILLNSKWIIINMQKDGRLILPGRSVNKNMYFTPRACGTIQPDKDMLLPLHIDFVGSF